MAEGAVDVTVAAAPDEVWKKVGDFGGVDKIFPGHRSFASKGDDRVIGMFGMQIRERLGGPRRRRLHPDLLRGRRRAGRQPRGHHHGASRTARGPR